jgi:hypothetical protein
VTLAQRDDGANSAALARLSAMFHQVQKKKKKKKRKKKIFSMGFLFVASTRSGRNM